MQEESKTFKTLPDLYYKKINALDELSFKGEKLAKFGVPQTKIGEAFE